MTVLEQRFEGEHGGGAAPGPKAAATGALFSSSRDPTRGASPGIPTAAQPQVSSSTSSAFSGRFSREGTDRQQGTLRRLACSSMGVPGVVSLSGGFPPADLFPIESMSVQLRGSSLGEPGPMVNIDAPTQIGTAQQYNLALRGYPPLVRWAEDHVARIHRPPPGSNHQVAITNGNNHTLEMLVGLLLDRGDSLLMEEYSYPHMLECVAAPKGLHVVPLPIDAQGIVPEAMEKVLRQLKAMPEGNVPFPKVLYTVPTALNPTGATITAQRRRQVYQICCRYDILIIEDDPYFYLQFPPSPCTPRLTPEDAQPSRSPRTGTAQKPPTPSNTMKSAAAAVAPGGAMRNGLGQGGGRSLQASAACCVGGSAASQQAQQLRGDATAWGEDPGAEELSSGSTTPAERSPSPSPCSWNLPPSSYLSLDTQARVVRCDSFAKFMAPGLRLGWVTAPPDLLDKVVMCLQAHTVGPCGLSQVVVSGMLEAWGGEGLVAHVAKVQQAYGRRAAIMLEAARKELTGLADWDSPTAGMFLWVRLLGVEDSMEIWDDLQRHKLVVLPGRVMHSSSSDPGFKCPYLRISFSHAPEADLLEGIRRLGEVLRARRAVNHA